MDKARESDVLHAAQHGSRGVSKSAPRPVPASTIGPHSGEREAHTMLVETHDALVSTFLQLPATRLSSIYVLNYCGDVMQAHLP